MNIQSIKLEFKELPKNKHLSETFVYTIIASRLDTKRSILPEICFYFNLEDKEILEILSTAVPFKTRSANYRFSEKRAKSKKFTFKTIKAINLIALMQKYAFQVDINEDKIKEMIADKQKEMEQNKKNKK